MAGIVIDPDVEDVFRQIDPTGALARVVAGMAAVETWVVDPEGRVPEDVIGYMIDLESMATRGDLMSAAHSMEIIKAMASMSSLRMMKLSGLMRKENPKFLSHVVEMATSIQKETPGEPYSQIILDRTRVLLVDELIPQIFQLEHLEAMLQ